MNITADTLRAALNSLKRTGAWGRIAKRAKVSHSTLVRFGSGNIECPRLTTCQAIHAAIEIEQRALARDPSRAKQRRVKSKARPVAVTHGA